MSAFDNLYLQKLKRDCQAFLSALNSFVSQAENLYPKLWRATKNIAVTGLVLLIWKFSSNSLQDIVVYGAAIYAACRLILSKPSHSAWLKPAGLAAIVVFGYIFLTLPFSQTPKLSFKDFAGTLEVFAGAFAVPVIFYNRTRLEAALLHSANAITLTLVYDLIRLFTRLGLQTFSQAHAFQPFILNHSNVACMVAGLAALIYFYFFITRLSSRPKQSLLALAAILSLLFYQYVLASRGPQTALAVTIASIGFLLPGLWKKILWGSAILLLAVLLAGKAEKINPRFTFVSSEQVKGGQTSGTLQAVTGFIHNNLSQRDIVWQHTRELARQRPWFGHGYGKLNFQKIYYKNPPKADFFYPHPHQYWLKLFFEFGIIGLCLHLTAWLMLAGHLFKCIYREQTFKARLWPGTIGLMLLFIHLYGLADYPDNIVNTALVWLFAAALTVAPKFAIDGRVPEDRQEQIN